MVKPALDSHPESRVGNDSILVDDELEKSIAAGRAGEEYEGELDGV